MMKLKKPGGDARFIFFIILVFLLILSFADAKMGYDISVTVNDSNGTSHYGVSQYTSVLNFQLSGSCSGDGNASRYDKVDGLAGNDFKETMFTKKGRLISSDQLTAISLEGNILIDEIVQNKSNYFAIAINESLPTIIYQKNDIYYRGDGIYQKDTYSNNEDHINTNYHANLFTKSVSYAGVYRGASIEAEITPTNVSETGGRNYSTAFRLSSGSDQYSGLAFKSDGNFIEEVYRGKYNINVLTTQDHKINYFNLSLFDSDLHDWLPCSCLSNDDIAVDGRQLDTKIFDASNI